MESKRIISDGILEFFFSNMKNFYKITKKLPSCDVCLGFLLRFDMTRNIVWGRSKVKMMVASTLYENCAKCLISKNVFMLYLVGARFRERAFL